VLSSGGTVLAIAPVRVTPTRQLSSGGPDDMREQTVKRGVSRWQPLALGVAVGYVTFFIFTHWAGSSKRGHLGAARNGFHPYLFV
jgi:hypothetical protein